MQHTPAQTVKVTEGPKNDYMTTYRYEKALQEVHTFCTAILYTYTHIQHEKPLCVTPPILFVHNSGVLV